MLAYSVWYSSDRAHWTIASTYIEISYFHCSASFCNSTGKVTVVMFTGNVRFYKCTWSDMCARSGACVNTHENKLLRRPQGWATLPCDSLLARAVKFKRTYTFLPRCPWLELLKSITFFPFCAEKIVQSFLRVFSN